MDRSVSLSHGCPTAWWDRQLTLNTRFTRIVGLVPQKFQKNFCFTLFQGVEGFPEPESNFGLRAEHAAIALATGAAAGGTCRRKELTTRACETREIDPGRFLGQNRWVLGLVVCRVFHTLAWFGLPVYRLRSAPPVAKDISSASLTLVPDRTKPGFPPTRVPD